MRPVSFLSTPPRITVAAEPLGDAAPPDANALDALEGLEIVPWWQARPARRGRGLWAATPAALAAVATAVALVPGRDAVDARAGAGTGIAPRATSPPLVVSARPLTTTEASGSAP